MNQKGNPLYPDFNDAKDILSMYTHESKNSTKNTPEMYPSQPQFDPNPTYSQPQTYPLSEQPTQMNYPDYNNYDIFSQTPDPPKPKYELQGSSSNYSDSVPYNKFGKLEKKIEEEEEEIEEPVQYPYNPSPPPQNPLFQNFEDNKQPPKQKIENNFLYPSQEENQTVEEYPTIPSYSTDFSSSSNEPIQYPSMDSYYQPPMEKKQPEIISLPAGQNIDYQYPSQNFRTESNYHINPNQPRVNNNNNRNNKNIQKRVIQKPNNNINNNNNNRNEEIRKLKLQHQKELKLFEKKKLEEIRRKNQEAKRKHQQKIMMMKKREKRKKNYIKKDERVKNIFGMSLEDAVIRPFDEPELKEEEFACSLLPLPVFRILQILEVEKSLRSKGLYRKSGSKNEIDELKRMYNKGQDPDLRKYNISTLTSLLKDYLKSLPEPLIPYYEYIELLDIVQNMSNEKFRISEIKRVILKIPAINKIFLIILITHLRKVKERQNENMMSVENIAIVFAPTIMKGENESAIEILNTTKDRIQIVCHLIKHFKLIFF